MAYAQNASGTWEALGALPQSQSSNGFGLTRNQRSQPTELAILASQTEFTDCANYITRCLDAGAAAQVQSIKNTTNTQNFCGQFQLAIQIPVKWAYRNNVPELTRGQAYANLDVKCEKKQ